MNGPNETIQRISSGVLLRNEEIIGVVVDRKSDQIFFYKNGKCVAIGLMKPSKHKELYVLIGALCSTTFEIVEKYNYHDLDRPMVQ
jgi:urea transporter